jgi:S1-C subfamily serine protease
MSRKAKFSVLILIITSWFFGTVCQECPLAVQEAVRALVRIAVAGIGMQTGQTEIARASGVVIGEEGCIVTCGHLFWVGENAEDRLKLRVLALTATTKEGTVRLGLNNLRLCEYNPIVDSQNDLALLLVNLPLKGLSVGEVASGQSVWLLGYQGPDDEATKLQGVVSLFTARRFIIQVDVLPQPGMSGAAVVNEKGQLVGIVTGTFLGRFVIASSLQTVPTLLESMKCQE